MTTPTPPPPLSWSDIAKKLVLWLLMLLGWVLYVKTRCADCPPPPFFPMSPDNGAQP